MRTVMCPRCGRPHPKGQKCPHCSVTAYPSRSPSRSRRTKEQEARRLQENPWRASYSDPAYQRARQTAMSRTSGCCAACGKPVATFRNGRWYSGKYGGVHHISALSEGGSAADPDNLVLLCTTCHNRIDAERRKSWSD